MGKVRARGFGVSIDGFGAGPDQSFIRPASMGQVASSRKARAE